MKRHTLPATILLVASVVLFVAILQSFRRVRRAEDALASARSEAALSRERLESSQRAAVAAKKGAAPADAFLASWKPEFDMEANIENVFGQLDTQAVNNLLSPSGKNFRLTESYFFNGHHMPVQTVNITVAGDYRRALNWLGSVESTFPLARVEQVSFATNGNSLTLAVEFVFPRRFDVK